MEFIETVEQIKSKYREAGHEDLATQVNECLMQGGTFGERFLILAEWLKILKVKDFEKYSLAYGASELILDGAKSFLNN